MTSQLRVHCLVAMGLLSGASLVAQTSVAAEDVATDSAPALEEIVVTASKREESLQAVPTAITALTGVALEQQGVTQFSEYMTAVPGLENVANGAAGHGQVIMRGLSTGILQNSPTVSFLIDNVPFTANQGLGGGSSVTPDPDLSDIERIEVLRGPQGTIYGASALGGLVKIVSKRPELDVFSADVRANYSSVDHGGNGYGVRGSMNIPLLSDKLAVRVAAFKRTDAGFMTNVATGATQTNETDVYGGKVSLLYQVSPDLDIELSGLAQNLSSDGWSGVSITPDGAGIAYCRYCYSFAVGPTFDTKYRLGSLNLNWKTSVGTLTNTLSYAQYKDPGVIDLSEPFSFVNTEVIGLPFVPVVTNESFPEMKKITEELRFATDRLGNFEGLAGVFYTHEDNVFDSRLINRDPATLAPLLPELGLDNFLTSTADATYKEYAVFANATYYFTDSFDVTLGGRYARNEQNAHQEATGLFEQATGQGTFESKENATTYLVTMRYRPTEQVDTYARVATGYRPGGPQLQPTAIEPYKHDTTTNYELGVKSRGLDGRLSTNLAVYYIDWKDIQLSGFDENGNSFTTNGGDAVSKGVELELAYLPVRGLTLQLTTAYNRSEMTSVNSNVIGPIEGDPLPYSPKWSGSAAADYAFPISASLDGSFGVSYVYQGERHTSWSQDATSRDKVLPSYDTLALRAGLEWSNYSLQLRASNVTDEYAFATYYANNFFVPDTVHGSSQVITPRTLTLEFAAKF